MSIYFIDNYNLFLSFSKNVTVTERLKTWIEIYKSSMVNRFTENVAEKSI